MRIKPTAMASSRGHASEPWRDGQDQNIMPDDPAFIRTMPRRRTTTPRGSFTPITWRKPAIRRSPPGHSSSASRSRSRGSSRIRRAGPNCGTGTRRCSNGHGTGGRSCRQ